MKPGSVAATGFDAGEPLLDAMGDLMGFRSFFANFIQIAVLLVAWVIILIAFFILSVQLFVTLIEFKLVTLADRKSVVKGKSVSVRVDLGGRRIIKKKNQITIKKKD